MSPPIGITVELGIGSVIFGDDRRLRRLPSPPGSSHRHRAPTFSPYPKFLLAIVHSLRSSLPSVQRSPLPMAETNEMACVYAALVLHDDGIAITVSLRPRLAASVFHRTSARGHSPFTQVS